VICAADCISLLIRLGIYGSGFRLEGRIPLRHSLRLVIHYRFLDTDEDDDVEGIRALGTMTWLRWLFFVFGTLTPAIKLMSFEGTPWTKAWGVMFLFSFLIVEAVVVLSWIDRQQRSPILDFGGTTGVEAIEKKLRVTDRALLWCAGLLQIFILLCTVADLWPNSGTGPKDSLGNASRLAAKIGVCCNKGLVITLLCIALREGWFLYTISRNQLGKADTHIIFFYLLWLLWVLGSLGLSIWYLLGLGGV
jgi:hypothetical protein